MFRRAGAVFLVLVFFAQPFLIAQDDDISTPCNAHLASITSTEPHALEKYFEKDRVPPAAEAIANKKLPNTVETIAVAPVTADDYKAIFVRDEAKKKEPLTDAQNSEIADVQTELKAKLGKDHGDRDFTGDSYKKALQAKAASFIIVLGHNARGFLRLLDGKPVFLDEIATNAREDQRVIFISCESTKHVSAPAGTISREITYDEGFGIAERLTKFIKSASGPLSLVEVQAFLSKDERIAKMKKLAFFVMKAACKVAGGVAVGIVVALIIRELDPCKDKDSPDCSDGKTKDGKSSVEQDSPDRTVVIEIQESQLRKAVRPDPERQSSRADQNSRCNNHLCAA